MKGAKKQEDADLSSRVSTQMMTTTMTSELGGVSHQGNIGISFKDNPIDSMRNMAKKAEILMT
jgi:hypothetical protein